MKTSIKLDEREIATILAALRMWQMSNNERQFFEDIATNGDEFDELSLGEIDALCERINLA